jgi:hypothetical protein
MEVHGYILLGLLHVTTVKQHLMAHVKSLESGLPDFSRYSIPKRGKIYQITMRYLHQMPTK